VEGRWNPVRRTGDGAEASVLLPSGEWRQYRVGIPRANRRGGRDAII